MCSVHRSGCNVIQASMRSLVRVTLLTALIFGSGRALAQPAPDASMDAPIPPLPDAGEPEPDSGVPGFDAGEEGCGNVTPEGFCENETTVVYCDTDTNSVISINCAGDVPTSRCIEINPTYGVDCAEAPGTACLAAGENGELFPLFCQGTMPGCLETQDDQVCTENLGTCTADQVGSCTGDRLLSECSEGQPYIVDCASYGAECESAACRGVDIGGYCDGIEFFCEADDLCVLNSCVPGQLPDSGVPAPDAGGGGGEEDAGIVTPGRADAGGGGNGGGIDEEDGGCGCTATDARSAGAGLAGAFALAMILALRKRRGR